MLAFLLEGIFSRMEFMTQSKIISLLILFITLNTAYAAIKDPVVATINGAAILKSTLEKNFQQNQLYLSTKKVTRKKVLSDLINRTLGIQKAKENKLSENPIVIAKIEDILYHAQISKDLEPQLKKIAVSDNEVRKFYGSNKEYRTSHILFRLKANPSKKEMKNVLKQAHLLYNRLKKNPNKFAEFANKYSQSTAAATGGDIGFQPPTRLAPEYFNAIKGKNVNYITPPIKTQFGLHVIKVLGVKPYKDINVDMYKKIIYDVKRDKIIEAYFKKARKKAKITINNKHL